MAPVANATAALCFALGGLVPYAATMAIGRALTPSCVAGSAVAGSTDTKAPCIPLSPEEYERQSKAIADTLRKILNQLGWTAASIGLTTGGISRTAHAWSSNQPTMLVGGVGMTVFPALLMVNSSLGLLTAFLMAKALLFVGMGNNIQNVFERKPGEAKRELDLRPLFSREGLKALCGSDDPSAIAQARAWTKLALRGSQFVVDDLGRIAITTGKALAEPLRDPFGTTKAVGKAAVETVQFVRGKRTAPPAYLEPSGSNVHVGAFVMIVGGVLVLVAEGPASAISRIGSTMIEAGTLTALSSVFLEGTKRSDTGGRAVLIGIPTMSLGTAFMQDMAGRGAFHLGHAFMDLFHNAGARKTHVYRSAPPSETPNTPEGDAAGSPQKAT